MSIHVANVAKKTWMRACFPVFFCLTGLGSGVFGALAERLYTQKLPNPAKGGEFPLN